MVDINDSRCFASYTLLRKLYDSEVNDVYEVIRSFIKYTIYTETMRKFDVFTLTASVNRVFGIRLIDAVIKRALKKLHLPVTDGIYSCNPSDFAETEKLKATIIEINNQSNHLYEELINHVQGVEQITLGLEERESLLKDFNSFMLGNNTSAKYADIIAQFVIICSRNPILNSQFKQAKEGVVIYSGLNYNAKTENASKKWSDEFTVFLDTEVIFHMAGYNGDTYKQLFDDFFSLVNEINSDNINKKHKKLIHLCYFEHTQKEIDIFFQRAEDIVKGNIPLISSVVAMKSITYGCQTPSDVAAKKVALETMLKTHGIAIDNNNESYYQEQNYKYNIESSDISTKISKEINVKRKEVDDALKSISHIFVLRKGKIETIFERGKYILVTDNYVTKYSAWHEDIKSLSGNVLCTDLYYFTDRLWCRLGKSFGLNASPKAYDVVSRAQVILSTHLNASISDQYDILLDKYNNHEITKEQVLEVLSELRKRVMNPEDIQTESNVDAALQTIRVKEIDYYIQEKVRKDAEFEKLKQDNLELETKLADSKNESSLQQKNFEKQLDSQKQTLQDEIKDIKEKSQVEKAGLLQQIAKLNAKTAMTEKLNNYREARKVIVSKKICAVRKQFAWMIVIFIAFVALKVLTPYLPKFDANLSWWKKVLLILMSVVSSQIIPLIRTKWFGAPSMSEVYTYIFKLKSFSTLKGLINFVHTQKKSPSYSKCLVLCMKQNGL